MAGRTRKSRRLAATRNAIVKKAKIMEELTGKEVKPTHKYSKYTFSCKCSACTCARYYGKREKREFEEQISKDRLRSQGFDGVDSHVDASWKSCKSDLI